MTVGFVCVCVCVLTCVKSYLWAVSLVVYIFSICVCGCLRSALSLPAVKMLLLKVHLSLFWQLQYNEDVFLIHLV